MAPNPIDFDKVFSADLSKNFVVLLVVCLIFGLYLLLVLLARRFDNKDIEKVRYSAYHLICCCTDVDRYPSQFNCGERTNVHLT